VHPIFIVIFLACAGCFFACMTMAGRSVGARIGCAVLGVGVFIIVAAIIERMVRNQAFFRRAVWSGPDMGPILGPRLGSE
jgi:hypothetical protein